MEEDTDNDSYNKSTKTAGLYSCTYCNLEFEIKKGLENHMKKHKMEVNENNMSCIICEFICENWATLKKHKHLKHPKRIDNSQLENSHKTSVKDVKEDDIIPKECKDLLNM